jgi:hypothetical protein
MRIKKDLVLRRIGAGFIIIDPDKGVIDMAKVYILNETATWLWKEIVDKDFTSDELIHLLLSRYAVTEEQARKDVNELIDSFKKQNLLIVE